MKNQGVLVHGVVTLLMHEVGFWSFGNSQEKKIGMQLSMMLLHYWSVRWGSKGCNHPWRYFIMDLWGGFQKFLNLHEKSGFYSSVHSVIALWIFAVGFRSFWTYINNQGVMVFIALLICRVGFQSCWTHIKNWDVIVYGIIALWICEVGLLAVVFLTRKKGASSCIGDWAKWTKNASVEIPIHIIDWLKQTETSTLAFLHALWSFNHDMIVTIIQLFRTSLFFFFFFSSFYVVNLT